MWALVTSRVLEPFDTRTVRVGAVVLVIICVTSMVVLDRRRSRRIQRKLRDEGLTPAHTIFAIRTRWGRKMRFGTALAFLPSEIVVVHGAGGRAPTRVAHRRISSIEHLDRAGVNHVAIHVDGTAYLFTLWPWVLLPQPRFGSRFTAPGAFAPSRASGSGVLREAILRSGIPFTAERIL
jgi:hypothetical protein